MDDFHDMDCADSVPQESDVMTDVPSLLEFPCLKPLHPKLWRGDSRFKTFGKNWKHEISAREMADAGFCYSGKSDKVYCFYCGGSLHNWQCGERPWYEHARWFPLCEFLLYKQGVSFVKKVSLKEPKLKRPKLKNPAKASVVQSILDIITPVPKQTDPRKEEQNELMEEIEILLSYDSNVQYAKKVGFDEDHIRRVLYQIYQEKKTFFSNRQELIQMLINFNKETSLVEKIKRLELYQFCSVCQHNEKDCLFLPCGHQSLCWDCAQPLKFCWNCNTGIKEKIRSYRV